MTQSLDKELRENPIAASVDFQRDGVQHGHLKLPYSRDDSAWGAVMIPVCVVKNGDGPPRCSPAATTATNTKARWRSAAWPRSCVPRTCAAG